MELKENEVACPKCGAVHHKDEHFCKTCGEKLDNDNENYELKPRFARKQLISTVIGFVLLLGIIIGSVSIANSLMKPVNFKDKYGEAYANVPYVEINNEGTLIRLISDPNSDYPSMNGNYDVETKAVLKQVLKELGFKDSTYEEITTSSSDELTTIFSDKYVIYWRNSDIHGLEVLILVR
ncbi:zinc ribbon domain-containing protein [Acholeplasma hippikon]|uniref:Predicted membrane protein n=1 Tax=Acholeplasma hippikon TaxID=264636 RepID=A0A449BL10_9MOLU|nr:zinc ribbon domain-containing protein [Acholeplasma hippikon]VEU83110.1 Predicted membrane protein [Acholeplasma hippikon]